MPTLFGLTWRGPPGKRGGEYPTQCLHPRQPGVPTPGVPTKSHKQDNPVEIHLQYPPDSVLLARAWKHTGPFRRRRAATWLYLCACRTSAHARAALLRAFRDLGASWFTHAGRTEGKRREEFSPGSLGTGCWQEVVRRRATGIVVRRRQPTSFSLICVLRQLVTLLPLGIATRTMFTVQRPRP